MRSGLSVSDPKEWLDQRRQSNGVFQNANPAGWSSAVDIDL